MKAKLFVCDSEKSYNSVHHMFTNKSYAECVAFDIIIDDIEVDCDRSVFLYRHADEMHLRTNGRRYPKRTCAFCSWQNFLLKFENEEFAELHRPPEVAVRYNDSTENRDAISRFKEDVATAIAGKSELILSDEEDFIV